MKLTTSAPDSDQSSAQRPALSSVQGPAPSCLLRLGAVWVAIGFLFASTHVYGRPANLREASDAAVPAPRKPGNPAPSPAPGRRDSSAAAPVPVLLNSTPMTRQTRMQIIRLLNAEYVFARTPFPMGEKGLVLKPTGEMHPSGMELRQAIAQNGPAANPGDRVQITNVEIKSHNILFEINGGPRKKSKWYQRIQVGGMGGMTPIARQPDPNSPPQGSSVTLVFDRPVPEMTLAELKQLLQPVFDFSIKSLAQAYTESLSPKLQEAIKNHQVLVGMNREMVLYAKGRPPHKVRERSDGGDYEEWIYGRPPEDVEFVRFAGEEVTQLKIMKVGGEKIVRTAREVDTEPGIQPKPQRGIAAGAAAQTPAKAPTLRRPGEVAPDRKPPSSVPSWPNPATPPPPAPQGG